MVLNLEYITYYYKAVCTHAGIIIKYNYYYLNGRSLCAVQYPLLKGKVT